MIQRRSVVVLTMLAAFLIASNVMAAQGFDYQSYLSFNSDLPQTWSKSECMEHYRLFGFIENRAVSFSLDEYLNANPDLPKNWTYAQALSHYNAFGKYEDRLLAFSADEYLSLYPDLPRNWTYEQAFSHYIYFGKQEGRLASFDETAYLEIYPDLPQTWGQAEAFYHYLLYGKYEGRVYDPYDEDAFANNGSATILLNKTGHTIGASILECFVFATQDAGIHEIALTNTGSDLSWDLYEEESGQSVAYRDDFWEIGDEIGEISLNANAAYELCVYEWDGVDSYFDLTVKSFAASSGDETTVDPNGGSISTGQATVTVPAGAVPFSADLSLTEKTGLTGYSDAAVGSSYQLTYSAEAINGELNVAIDLPSSASNSLKLAVSENGAGRYSMTGEASINFLEATVSGSTLTARLPLYYGATETNATVAGSPLAGKRLLDFGATEVSATDSLTAGVSGGTVELQPIYILESRSQPFVLNYPHTWPVAENRPGQLLTAAQDAVTKLRGLGYSHVNSIGAPDDTGVRWFPLNVSQGMGATKFAEQALTKSGENHMYVDINNTYCDSANLDTMRIQMGHEIFHAVQELMDPRNTLETLLDQKTLLWLKEASSVWFEYEMSGQGKSYMPDSHSSWDAYAIKGLEMGTDGTEAQNIGYWASNFLRYLTDTYPSSDILFNTWQNVIAQGDGPYSGLAALIDALGGATQAAYRFADFAGLWLFGQTDYRWNEPAPTGSFSASRDTTPTAFTGTSYPYSCEKYQFIFGATASDKEYTISVDQGLGANGMLFQLYAKTPGSSQVVFVENLTGPFSFTSAGNEVYYVAVINGDPSRTTGTAFRISLESESGTCQPVVDWDISGSAVYIDDGGGPASQFGNGPDVIAPEGCCWQASVEDDWLELDGSGNYDPSTGRGCGSVYFNFNAYCNCSQSQRRTYVTIAGERKMVIQQGQSFSEPYCPASTEYPCK